MVPLGPFRLTHRLGRGGMGEVWGGRHGADGTPVALKVITDAAADDPAWRSAFRNEVRAVAGLDHPGIVQVYDFGQVDAAAEAASRAALRAGSPYLVMELLDGGPLRVGHSVTDWARCREVLQSLLAALAHAHARGVVHRDLKPDNVLFTAADGRLKLTDFGVAHATVRADGTQEAVEAAIESTVGTPGYMAPEQIRGRWRDQGPWTDLYAVGCLAFELVCGRTPYARDRPLATVMAHLGEPIPGLTPRFPVPDGFETWVRGLLAKNPAARTRRAADAAWILHALRDAPRGGAPMSPRRAATAPPLRAAEVLAPTLGPGADEALTVVDVLTPTLVGEEPPTEPDGVDALDDVVVEVAAAVPAGSTLPPWLGPGPTVPLAAQVQEPPGEGAPPMPVDWRSGLPVPPRTRPPGIGLGLFGLRAVPFVGREAERDLLWRRLREVRAFGTARAVGLIGPAGYGKSRLAAWLAERGHEVGAVEVLRAHHAPGGGPNHGLGPMLAHALRCVGLPRDEVAERVGRLMTELGATDAHETDATVELICPAPPGTEGAMRFGSPREAYAALTACLRRLATRRALLVWLDDVQWSHHALDFAAHLLAEGGDGLRVLVVLTAQAEALAERPAEARRLDALVERGAVQAVHVGPLEDAQRSALVAALLGLEDDLARQLDARTAGNPLFAVQLVGDWVQRGALEAGGGGFRLRHGLTAGELDPPPDLQTVWAERVERVLADRPEAHGRALEVAAVLGQQIDAEEWRAACAEAGLEAPSGLVEALLDLRLAVCDAAGPEVGWGFVHTMLREALERRARAADRLAPVHRACAEALLSMPGTVDDERVGRHLLAAGAPAEAAPALGAAANARLDRGDYPAAADLLDALARALEQAGAGPTDARRVGQLVLRARLHRYRAELDEAESAAMTAQRAAERAVSRSMRAAALEERARVAKERGLHAEAAELLRAALVDAEAGGHGEVAASAREALGAVLAAQGDLDGARAALIEARAAFDAGGDATGAGRSTFSLAQLETQAGRLDEATRHCRDALELFRLGGARNGTAACDNQLGELARLRGDLGRAEEHYRQALHLWSAMGATNAVFARANLALVLLESGDPAAARPLLAEALARFEAHDQRAFAAVANAALLPCDAHAADWLAFDARVERADALLSETRLVDADTGRLLEAAGDTARAAGEWARAVAAYGLARQQWAALERAADVERVDAALAAALA